MELFPIDMKDEDWRINLFYYTGVLMGILLLLLILSREMDALCLSVVKC